MNDAIKKYFINALLIIFSWFFLVSPWFVFSTAHTLNKVEYKDASKENTSYDSTAYFQITKDESDTDSVGLDKNFTFCFYTFNEFAFFLFGNFFSTNQNLSYKTLFKNFSIRLHVLNNVFQI